MPITLVLIEFDGVDMPLVSRLVGVERTNTRVGMKLKTSLRHNTTWPVRDVYFVRAGS